MIQMVRVRIVSLPHVWHTSQHSGVAVIVEILAGWPNDRSASPRGMELCGRTVPPLGAVVEVPVPEWGTGLRYLDEAITP